MDGYVFGGRGMIQGGRTLGTIVAAPAASPWNAVAGGRWPGCRPIQCCCKGPWFIAPGEALPLQISYLRWLTSEAMGGYTMRGATASLMDVSVRPEQVADPTKIRIVSGIPGDPTPGDNADAAGLVNIMPSQFAISVTIATADDAVIGAQYRLNLAVFARDCDGRVAKLGDCVTIVVAQC